MLLLDEPTAHLDAETESLVLEATREFTRGRTAVIVAHRLSTIAAMDRLIVMDKGRIVERGTHGELLEQKGLYAGMWDRQREADEAAERLRRTREAAGAFLPPEQAQPEAAE